jgi:outer membrane protein OmpA-like peptidoglycan-associated protein
MSTNYTAEFPASRVSVLFSNRALSFGLSNGATFAALLAFALLAGCAQHSQPMAASAPTPYNPPGAALAQLPPGNIAWFHVMFANDSTTIDAAGHQVIDNAAASMQGNPAMIATVIGKTDSAGSASGNMLLSQERANAVRRALLRTGKVTPQQIETHWTGERQQGAQTTGDMASTGNRVVDIGVH